jgi:hypothetical protein
VLPYKNFEPTLSFSSWSLFHYNSTHINQLRYVAAKRIFSLHRLKSILILLACDVARNPGPIKIDFCNIRSIRNKSALIFDYISSNGPDIFGLSETHLSKDESASLIQDLTPPGYMLFHLPRPDRPGGGVGCFIKSSLTGTIIPTPKFSTFEVLLLQVKSSNLCFYFTSIYRPPSTSKSTFLNEFQSFIGFLSTFPSPFIITGDFNIHMDTGSLYAEKFKHILDACDLIQHVKQPTHIHGHIIDLFISSPEVPVYNVRVGDCVSDHFSITSLIDFQASYGRNNKIIKHREFHKINQNVFKDDLKNTSFVSSPASDLHGVCDQYFNDLSLLLEKHAPLKLKAIHTNNNCSWINEQYLSAKRTRRQCERQWRKYRSPLFRSRLRRQVNYCVCLATKLKSSFYSNVITSCCSNPKKLWSKLNIILGRNSEAVLPDAIDPKSLANKFCGFFVEKIQTIRQNFVSTDPMDVKPNYNPPIFDKFMLISEQELREIVLNSPCKSCSLDPWPTFLIKENIDIILPSLTKLVNMSLSQGIFPPCFKNAVVTPLIKKRSLDKDDLKNYRPISGLSFISKLVERVVVRQIKTHCEVSNLDNLYQSAYKSGHSTETALLNIKSNIEMSLAKGHPTALVMLDLSAAFDTIDHTTLLDCLHSWFGFSGTVLNWFLSYLSDRSQMVKINDFLSERINIPFGVPQGSVLGPILFSLYTYPLCQIIKSFSNIGYHFYADDTQIYCHLTPSGDPSDFSNLQNCLQDIQKWMNSVKLKLNPGKTEFIVFGSEAMLNKIKHCFPVDILGHQLLPVKRVCNLGVFFDASLSFRDHISSVCKSSFLALRNFASIRKYLTISTATMVANALVSCRFDYCNSLFTGISTTDFTRLQCIQNSLARVIRSKHKYDHITPTLKSLHWLPVRYRCHFKILTLVYKYLSVGSPAYFGQVLQPYTSCVNTRHSDAKKRYLKVPKFKTKTHSYVSKRRFDGSFMYVAPQLWNSLPIELRTSPSLYIFRRKLKTHLFAKAYPP